MHERARGSVGRSKQLVGSVVVGSALVGAWIVASACGDAEVSDSLPAAARAASAPANPATASAAAPAAANSPAQTPNAPRVTTAANAAAARPSGAAQSTELPPLAPIDFVERASERGLDYVNRSGTPAKATILEANGAGVALFDLASDGDYDIAFSQGLAALEQVLSGPGADLAVYANDGSAHFTPARAPGLSGWWTGLATGDLDGDGHADLVAGAYGDLAALVQRDGELVALADSGLMPSVDAAPHARLVIGAPREAGHAPWWTTSLALADFDLDGALDLYVGQYLELDPVDPPIAALGSGPLSVKCEWKERRVFCGPQGLVAQPDRVLRGRGDGAFSEVTETWLPQHPPGYTLAVAAWDLDEDGDSDVYVANDGSPNLLLENDGRGVLRDRARELGVAVGTEGMAYAGMGVACGDVNRDGRSDFSVTNFSDQPTQLYLGSRARGDGERPLDSGARTSVSGERARDSSARTTDSGTNAGDSGTPAGDVSTQAGDSGNSARGAAADASPASLGPYDCQTWRVGLGIETRRLLSWGVHLADFDADGWLELLTANGHVYPQADSPGTDTSYGQAATLWRLPPGKRCARVLPTAEDSVLRPALGARGSAVGDLDGDGWQDLVLVRIDQPVALGLYAGPRTQQRLLVRLSSPAASGARAPNDADVPSGAESSGAVRRTPRDGRGARVRVVLADEARPLCQQAYTAVGFQSASSPELCFGLGTRAVYSALEIAWPSGRIETIASGKANQRLWIEEGRGVVRSEELR
jgi:hypothetical protein